MPSTPRLVDRRPAVPVMILRLWELGHICKYLTKTHERSCAIQPGSEGHLHVEAVLALLGPGRPLQRNNHGVSRTPLHRRLHKEHRDKRSAGGQTSTGPKFLQESQNRHFPVLRSFSNLTPGLRYHLVDFCSFLSTSCLSRCVADGRAVQRLGARHPNGKRHYTL